MTRRRSPLAAVIAAGALVVAGCGDEDPPDAFVPFPTATLTATSEAASPTVAAPEATATATATASASARPSTAPEATETAAPVRTPDANVAPGPEKLRRTAVPVGIAPEGAPPADDAAAAQKALRTFLIAISTSNGYQACAQLSVAGRRAAEREIRKVAPETGGAPCENTLPLYQSTYSGTPVRVRKLSVSGTTATAEGPLGESATLSKYGDAWLVDRYGNITG